MTKKTYNFLVAAALQEELSAFYDLSSAFHDRIQVEGDAYEVTFNFDSKEFKILTYTSDVMGMPYNAAALMNIINLHHPVYTLFIGTCAGLIEKGRTFGDVLVPTVIFSYESGKYENGTFHSDQVSKDTGHKLRKQAEIVRYNNEDRKFKVFTDEKFICGAAVINDKEKKREITVNAARKVTGLDMESYAIACINSILAPGQELIVIKGISDFGKRKSQSESKGYKTMAKKNSAEFALEIILHYQKNFFSSEEQNAAEENSAIALPGSLPDDIEGSDEQLTLLQISSPPYGKVISIMGSNGQFVSSEGGQIPMHCNRQYSGSYEQFLVVDAGGGKFALENNGKYVTSQNGASPIVCNRPILNAWEKFEWIVGPTGVGFKGNNSCFVSSQNGSGPMTCNISAMKSWESFQIFFVQNDEKTAITKRKVLLNSKDFSMRDFQIQELKLFEDNKEVGETGRGELEINNGTWIIKRTNHNGRLLLKIINYHFNGTEEVFIPKSSITPVLRRLNVRFEAKVINSKHTFFIICKHIDKDQWIHNAFLKITIDAINWEKYDLIIRLPANLDFVIDLVDRDVAYDNSSLIIKDFTIEG